MEKTKYIRDKRSPVPKSDSVSKVMSRNKARNTKPELLLRKNLWAKGLRGYRTHYRSVPGRPDIAFPSRKIAIFVNGCYWHRCPHCNLPSPKHNVQFWTEKFKKNKIRDLKKVSELEQLGWIVYVFWECEIKKDLNQVISKIQLTNGKN